MVLSGISPSFDELSQSPRQIVHVLLTRAPVYYSYCYEILPRLACLRHAASVRSEPGSNSPLKAHCHQSQCAASAKRRSDRNSKKSDRLQIHSGSPAAQLLACTTIQFSKTGPLRAKGNNTARFGSGQHNVTEFLERASLRQRFRADERRYYHRRRACKVGQRKYFVAALRLSTGCPPRAR